MKKVLLTIVLSVLMSITALAQEPAKVVTDSVTFMPSQVQIFEGVTKNGNTKWWIEIPAENGVKKVNLSQSHVTSDRLLALIERMDTTTGKYSYSVKFAEPKKKSNGKADLSGFKGN